MSDMADRLAPVSDALPAVPPATPGTPARLLLIDGHSMAYRAFFALPVDKFATSAGEPTNAVFGFFSMIANLLRDEEPTHVAVAFDAGRTTFRTEVYEAYKGNRDATPEPFSGQVAVIQRVLETMHIPSLSKPQFEADDILATLSVQARAQGMQVLICSGDRDALQLVNDDVTVLYPVKGVSELARMTPAAVEDEVRRAAAPLPRPRRARRGVQRQPAGRPGRRPEDGRQVDRPVRRPAGHPRLRRPGARQGGGVAAREPGPGASQPPAQRAAHGRRAAARPRGPGGPAVGPAGAARDLRGAGVPGHPRPSVRDAARGEGRGPAAPSRRPRSTTPSWAPASSPAGSSARAGRPLGVDVRGSGAPASGDAWGIALADPDGQARVVRPGRDQPGGREGAGRVARGPGGAQDRARGQGGLARAGRPRAPDRRGRASTPSSRRTCASRTGAPTT